MDNYEKWLEKQNDEIIERLCKDDIEYWHKVFQIFNNYHIHSDNERTYPTCNICGGEVFPNEEYEKELLENGICSSYCLNLLKNKRN